ncbi:myosin-2 essential light chain-like isoform X2 [Hydractinia symbiolongicarpus]|uniref:myosin-2 essential light chain-like isoform X2 n=1 Tax=Hydractinia symbiolongicarpus TaxID=13093 RepID=UPI00254C19E0|nr:myosin-2 essential light chain-like isoform X2 [Hydractinia symbiolongicarpus]
MPSYDDNEEYRDTFSLFDKQGDGKVECSSLGEMLRALGLNPTEAEVKKIVAEIDPTGQKRITFEEFIPLYHAQSKKKNGGSMEAFAEAFRIFDRENNGMVSVAEVRHLLTSLGEKLSSEDVDVLVQGMEDNSGMVNYEEFVRGVMS